MILQGQGPSCAGTSRRVVREALSRHAPADLADAAVLLVSEIVTNALCHGGGPRELTVEADAWGITVSVSDASPYPPLQRDQRYASGESLAENGRGLTLLAALADDWGWTAEATGKRVWFRLRSGPHDGEA